MVDASAGDAGSPLELPVEVARWLVTDDGLAAVISATAALDADDDPLAVGTRLATEGLDAPRRAAVLGAATARRRARQRWPDADRLLFTRTALEQASDPAVSAWRARRFTGCEAVEDRAAGVGGDTLALAAAAGDGAVTASDRDAARLVLLAHNAAVRGVDVEVVVDDALRRPPPSRGPVHVDPARRVGERRVRTLADHRPSVPALLTHLATVVDGAGVAVVTSPALDLDDPDLPGGAELEFVQVDGDLVEAVVWTGHLRQDGVAATATLLAPDGRVRARATRAERTTAPPVAAPDGWLVHPAPAAVRARLHDQLAPSGARRVAQRRALWTCPTAPPPSPWWVARPIVACLPARPAAVRRWLRGVDVRPVELVRHGLDVDLAGFRRGLGRPPSGPEGWRVELIRTDEGAYAVITDGDPQVAVRDRSG